MTYEILPPLFSGIGMLFVGGAMLKSNFRKMYGCRLRRFLQKYSSKDWQAALIGAATGFVTQNTSVAAAITAGLVSSGQMTVRTALPVTIWSNAGCAVLVLAAVLNLKHFAAVLLFITGLSCAFDWPRNLRYPARSLFGVGLLIYGLHVASSGAARLPEIDFVQGWLSASDGSLFLAFAFGLGLRMLTQVFIGNVFLGITLHTAGLLNLDQAILFITGVHLGSSVMTIILSAGVTGSPRQVTMAQALHNIIGTAVVLFLVLLEFHGGVSFIREPLQALTPDPELQLAVFVIVFSLVLPLALFPFHTPVAALLRRVWPPVAQERLGRPAFVHELSIDAPDSALDLIDKEIVRLTTRLPAYTDQLRTHLEPHSPPPKVDHHKPFLLVSKEIRASLAEVSQSELAPQTGERLLDLQARLRFTIIIEEALHGLAFSAQQHPPTTAQVLEFHQVILESLDMLVFLAVQATMGDAHEQHTLARLTSTPGPSAEATFSRYQALAKETDTRSKAAMLRAANFYERAVWALHKLATIGASQH